MGHQFEGMLADIDRMGDQRQFQREREHYEDRIADLRNYLARAYGLREALLVQLKISDPSNPLVQDEDLRERIATSASRAFFANRDPDGTLNFNRAKEVGRTFKIPGR